MPCCHFSNLAHLYAVQHFHANVKEYRYYFIPFTGISHLCIKKGLFLGKGDAVVISSQDEWTDLQPKEKLLDFDLARWLMAPTQCHGTNLF